MSEISVELEEVVGLARSLSPLDKVSLVEEVMSFLEEDLAGKTPSPKRSFYGNSPDADVWAEDIKEVRWEMWGDFQREDI